ncbi:Uncharacterised protein [Achromobacter sp. 2789STDY5608615]|nr:Uncharacterised protein [Achromobacter sp. 2789STDY5608615]
MPCARIAPLVVLSTLTVSPCPMNTANALWLQGALSAPVMPVQLSLVSAPLAVQMPGPPSMVLLFLFSGLAPSQ